MKIIILCGGIGSRLWPMSRKDKPKQFFEIVSSQPMVIDTFERFKGYFDEKDIYLATTVDFAEKIKELFPEIGNDQLIIEPARMDSGPAMGFSAAHLFLKFPDEPIVFVPTDHFIGDRKKFILSLKVANKLIRETSKMLDIAVEPNFPSTILGYTQIGEKYDVVDGVEVYEFKGHKEKPDFNTAKKYLGKGNYLWHANFYMWTPRLFLEAYKKYAPEVYGGLEKIINAIKKNQIDLINQEYFKFPKISFDYLITEKMAYDNVLIIKGDFGWSDIGGWDVLFDQLSAQKDINGNLLKGKCLTIDTNDTLIYGQPDKIIATIGLNGMSVVDTGDALLICPRGRAQDVKKIVELLKEKKLDKYA